MLKNFFCISTDLPLHLLPKQKNTRNKENKQTFVEIIFTAVCKHAIYFISLDDGKLWENENEQQLNSHVCNNTNDEKLTIVQTIQCPLITMALYAQLYQFYQMQLAATINSTENCQWPIWSDFFSNRIIFFVYPPKLLFPPPASFIATFALSTK